MSWKIAITLHLLLNVHAGTPCITIPALRLRACINNRCHRPDARHVQMLQDTLRRRVLYM